MELLQTKRITRENVNQWLDDYYDERGWDIEKGIPKKDKLVELGLGDMAPDLEKAKL